MSSVIIGTGHYLPEWKLTNDDLEAMGLGYDRVRAGGVSLDEWAEKHVGVRSRHRIRPGEGTSDLGTRAAQQALDDAGLQASDLGLIVLSTFSSDHRAPSTAALVQANLGATCKFYQLDAACCGFVDSLITAEALMNYMEVDYALVVSADAVSIYCAPDNFMTNVIFGDGAGAVILRRMPDSTAGLRAHYTAGDGSKGRVVWVPGGGTKDPISAEMLAAGRQYAQWSPQENYVNAVENMSFAAEEALRRAKWSLEDVDWVIPHQAGRNIILDVMARIEFPPERVIINIDHVGNTSGASISIALDEANRAGKFKAGDKLLLPAFGAGLAWGAVALVWHDYRAARKGQPVRGNGHSG